MGVNFVTQNQEFLNLTDTNVQVVTTRSGLHQLRKRLHTFANTYTQNDLQGSFLPPLKHVLKFILHKRVERESMYVFRNYHKLTFTPLQHPFDYFLE